MSRPSGQRVVAELGRPETPEETAARKAASSRAYRSSMTFRNLLVALGVTLAMVLVIVWAVPRGEPATSRQVDLAAAVANVEQALDRPVLVPEVPADWLVNAAVLSRDTAVPTWDMTLTPDVDDNTVGFVRVSQAFGADASWAPQRLGGTAPTGETAHAGFDWDLFTISNPSDNGNIARGMGTQVGDDYVLLYGSFGEQALLAFAERLAPQLRTLEEAR